MERKRLTLKTTLTRERLITLLYNAIALLEENGYDIEQIVEEVGITSEEYDKVMYD